jgi:RNA polymerase sigma factor (sigma-70 family)
LHNFALSRSSENVVYLNLETLPIHSSLVLALSYHYDDLVDYVRRHFTSHHASNQHFSKEVVHDVCVSIIANPPNKTIETPLAFLRLAVKHRAVDLHRAELARNKYIDFVADTPDDHMHHQSGEHALDIAQKLYALKNMIEALPPRQKHVFLLHRLHEMPQQEIADALGISRNMVTQHFNRALATVQAQWKVYLTT